MAPMHGRKAERASHDRGTIADFAREAGASDIN